VFVTGGAGVIGQQMVAMLVDAGARVIVGDLKPRPMGWDASVQYREGDLNSLTVEEFQSIAPDVLIHLAATFERSEESAGFWADNFHNNVLLSHHLMDLARQVNPLRRVVFASSYLCYDSELYMRSESADPVTPPALRETDAVRPRNLVGMAKFAHEKELAFLQEVGDVSFTHASARIFRGYGLGSRDYISRTARALLRGEAITAYRVEGEFDYVFCRDAAAGLLAIAANEEFSGVVNLGTGRRRSVSDVFDILREHFDGMVVDVQPSDLRIESSEADTSLLEELTGWCCPTSLEDGIREIVEFERGAV